MTVMNRHTTSTTARTIHLPTSIACCCLVFLSFICLLFAHDYASAQSFDERSVGRTYIIAFPDTVYNRFERTFMSASRHDTLVTYNTITIYSPVKNQVRITGENYFRSVPLEGGEFTTINLNAPGTAAPNPILNEIGTVSNNTFHLEAVFPIKVYCYVMSSRGGEAWAPLPVECWGIDYYAGMNPGDVVYDVNVPNLEAVSLDTTARKAPSSIVVIAAYDDTQVTIYPQGPLEGNPPTTVTLNANQAYQVQSLVDLNKPNKTKYTDLGGTRIVGSKPIGVLSGNTRSQVIDDEVIVSYEVFTARWLRGNSAKNILYEWLLPVEHHGTEFVYLPPRNETHPDSTTEMPRRRDYVRVYGTAQATTAITYINGKTGAANTATVENGRFIEFGITPSTPYTFRTDHPAQIMVTSTPVSRNRSSLDPFNITKAFFETWAPAMVTMLGKETWATDVPFYTPPYPFGMKHYVNVVTEEQYRDDIVFEDGRPFDFNQGKLQGSNLIWGTLSLKAGEGYYLRGKNGATFSGFVYGSWKGYESFLPQGTRKKGNAPAIQSAEDKGPSILHPAEYDEVSAVSYSYPLTQISTCCLGVPTSDDIMLEASIAENIVDSINLSPAIVPVTLDAISPDAVIQSFTFTINYDHTVARLKTELQDLIAMVDNTVLEDWSIEVNKDEPGNFSAIVSSPSPTTVLNETGTLLFLRFQKYIGEAETTGLDFQIIPSTSYCSRIVTNPGNLRLEICGLTERLMEISDTSLTLNPVSPNPVVDKCSIEFSIPFSGTTSLKVYDTQGTLVANLVEDVLEKGGYSVQWQTEEQPSGLYYYQLRYGNKNITRSLLLTR